jgi:hypothetical protein
MTNSVLQTRPASLPAANAFRVLRLAGRTTSHRRDDILADLHPAARIASPRSTS